MTTPYDSPDLIPSGDPNTLHVMNKDVPFQGRLYLLHIRKLNNEENGQELDHIDIWVWKYVRIGINADLKNQVENHSKIDNYVNNQKSKISKYNFSKAWKEKRGNIM